MSSGLRETEPEKTCLHMESQLDFKKEEESFFDFHILVDLTFSKVWSCSHGDAQRQIFFEVSSAWECDDVSSISRTLHKRVTPKLATASEKSLSTVISSDVYTLWQKTPIHHQWRTPPPSGKVRPLRS